MRARAVFALAAPFLLTFCGGPAQNAPGTEVVEIKVNPNGVSATLPPAPAGKLRMSLDRVGEVTEPAGKAPVVIALSGDIVASGFAIDEAAHALAGGVDIAIDSLPFGAHYQLDRPDVATFFKTPAYEKAGFQFTMPAKFFGKGKHTLVARAIANDRKAYYEGPPVTLDIQ